MSYVHRPSTRPMEHRTPMELFDYHANTHPDREAFVLYALSGQRSSYSFQLMQQQSLFLAASFLKLGWGRGQRVVLLIPNRIEFLLSYMALLRIGVNAILLPTGKNVDEVIGLVKLSKSDGIVAYVSPDRSFTTELISGLENIIPSSKIVLIDAEDDAGSQAKYSHYNDLLEAGLKLDVNQVLEEQNQVQMDDPAVVMFTSGSTGQPKGSQLAHHLLVNGTIDTAINACGIKLNVECRLFNDRPFYWAGFQHLGILLVLSMGCTLVCVPTSKSFRDCDVNYVLSIMQNEKCTHSFLLPYMLLDMSSHPEFNIYDLSSLRTIFTAGQPLHSSTFAKLRPKLPKCDFVGLYGQTEIQGVASQVFNPESAENSKYEGMDLFPSYEIKIIDEDNKLVPVGDMGEICIRSPAVKSFLGYLENPNATAKVISRSGWVHTSDIGLIDERGKLTICGRTSDRIKRATVTIFPAEIEKVLVKYPDVKDVLVVGVPDERLYEELCACVIPKEGSVLETNGYAFEEWMSQQWKLDEQGLSLKPKYVVMMKEFPKTTTGKPNRKDTRIQAIHKLGLENI